MNHEIRWSQDVQIPDYIMVEAFFSNQFVTEGYSTCTTSYCVSINFKDVS